MTFKPLKQLSFNLLDGSAPAVRGLSALSIRKHRIDLSNALYLALGEPKKVEIGTDGDYLGIRRSKGTGIPVRKSSTRAVASVPGMNLSHMLIGRFGNLTGTDLDRQYVSLSVPFSDGDWTVFDVRSAQIRDCRTRNQE